MLKIKRLVIDRFVHGRHAIETFESSFPGAYFFCLFQNTLLSIILIYFNNIPFVSPFSNRVLIATS